MRAVLVTCMGRSGSKFLAGYLNSSPTWNVEHEPAGGWQSTRDALTDISRKSNSQNYCRVDSYLRHQMCAFAGHPLLDELALILRDPMEIAQSMWNRNGHKPFKLEHLNEALLSLDAAMRAGVAAVITFRSLPGRGYRLRIARQLGIHDVDPDCDPPRNGSKQRPMPAELRKKIEAETGWFSREYEAFL